MSKRVKAPKTPLTHICRDVAYDKNSKPCSACISQMSINSLALKATA
jgi:hypothetical protein